MSWWFPQSEKWMTALEEAMTTAADKPVLQKVIICSLHHTRLSLTSEKCRKISEKTSSGWGSSFCYKKDIFVSRHLEELLWANSDSFLQGNASDTLIQFRLIPFCPEKADSPIMLDYMQVGACTCLLIVWATGLSDIWYCCLPFLTSAALEIHSHVA